MSQPRWRDPPVPEDAHDLLALSDELEKATEELRAAIDTEAEADVAFKRAHAIAMVTKVQDVADTMRSKVADAFCVNEDVDLTYAKAGVKRCRAKVDQVSKQLMAHQSYAKVVGGQT